MIALKRGVKAHVYTIVKISSIFYRSLFFFFSFVVSTGYMSIVVYIESKIRHEKERERK